MTTLESIKNRLVDRILAVQDEKFLEAIERIFVTTQKEEIVKLYPEQRETLMMSDADIAEGNVVSESELEKLDSQWMYCNFSGPQSTDWQRMGHLGEPA